MGIRPVRHSVAFVLSLVLLAGGLCGQEAEDAAKPRGAFVHRHVPFASQDGGFGSGGWCLAVSPDGAILARGMANGDLVLHDTTTGDVLRTLTAHPGKPVEDGEWSEDGGVTAVAFAPDGRLMATGGAARWSCGNSPTTGRPRRTPDRWWASLPAT